MERDLYNDTGSIIDKLRSFSGAKEKYLTRLLAEMENMDSLDEANRILIIENMAGRTAGHTDSGLRLVSEIPDFAAKLKSVMTKMIARGTEYTPDRFEAAVKSYKEACRSFRVGE